MTTTRTDYLPFFRPLIEEDDVSAMVHALRSGWLTTGPRTKEFERTFAAAVGSPRAVAVNSCTSGLHAGLVALGVKPGDEVVTTPYTFVASVETILLAGARPVLVDVEPDTLNLDPARLAPALTPRTRCIVPVHIAGHPCEMDAIHDVARGAGIPVMEDAAHAFPAAYRGKSVGTISDLTVFSFYATKNLTTGEGGMITTADDELADRLEKLILHGMSRGAWKRYGQEGSWFYEVTEHGFKYNLSDLLATLGLSQLAKMDRMMARRRDIVARYRRDLGGEPAFQVPEARPHVESAWHLFVLRLNPGVLRIDRDAFIQEMAARQVGCSVHFIPVHLHPYYRDALHASPGDYPVALREYSRALSLPLFPAMTDGDVDSVIEAALDVARIHRR